MRVVVHHSQYYEWDPVPPDVVVTEADIAAGRVRPVSRPVPGTDRLWHGNWTMRVARQMPTHTEAHIPDTVLWHAGFHRDVRPMRPTRQQALALHLASHVLPERLPAGSITGVEVHDDGPDESAVAPLVDEHVAAGNLASDEKSEHLDRFLSPAKASHDEHLCKHFRVPAKSVAS